MLTQSQKDSDDINNYQRKINRLKEQTAYLTMKINQNKKEIEKRGQGLYRALASKAAVYKSKN